MTDLRELQEEYKRQQREVTDERIAVGALIRTILSEADGLTFKDGRKELAYLKVRRDIIPHGGRLCRGRLFPRLWDVTQYEHARKIDLAF